MRSASILLVLIIVPGFMGEAWAQEDDRWIHQRWYGIEVGENSFGFLDWLDPDSGKTTGTIASLGPLGIRQVPFTAIQGLAGFCVIVLTLIALLATFAVRWKRRTSV